MTPEQLKRLEEIKYTIEVSEETQWLIAQLEAEAGENVILRAAQKNTLSSRDAWKTEAEAAEAECDKQKEWAIQYKRWWLKEKATRELAEAEIARYQASVHRWTKRAKVPEAEGGEK
jgi:hypothetical protein